jgi:hypothetical protein
MSESTDNNPALQHLPIFYILSGCGVIFLGLFFVAGIIALPLVRPGGNFEAIFFSPFACLFAWLSLKQYSSLFCCKPAIARVFYEAYFILGIFALFVMAMFVCLLVSLMFERNLPKSEWLDLFGTIAFAAAIGLICITLGVVNYLITSSRRKLARTCGLVKVSDFSVKLFGMPGYRTRTILGIALMSGIVALMAGYSAWTTPQWSGEHLSYAQFPFRNSFPADGEDFYYIQMVRGTIYCEFTITEQGFRNWIDSQSRWKRCHSITEENPERIWYREKIVVTDGIFAGWGNGTGGRAIFDRSTNRAYYWTYY